MAKKVTLQSIADELQISKSLVSKALSNQSGVSEETKERVRFIAMKQGYRINSSVRSVSTSQTGNVALLVPREDLSDFEYWGKIIHGIEKELSQKSFSMILAGVNFSLSTSEGMPSCITDRKVDGALILGLVPTAYILAVQATGIPVVLVDSFNSKLKLDHVIAENYLGSYEATRYLLDRNHRTIGFVGDITYSYSFNERYRGYVNAIKDFQDETGIVINDLHVTSERGNSYIPYCVSQLEMIIADKTAPVTGLVCANDPIAFEVIQLLEKNGLSCPQDVSLIGFDNLKKCEWSSPTLTTVDACKETMGNRAVELLFRRMKERSLRPEHVMIVTEIIERNSVEVLNP